MNLHDFIGAAYKYMNAVHENQTHYKGHDPTRIVLSTHHSVLEPEVWAIIPDHFVDTNKKAQRLSTRK